MIIKNNLELKKAVESIMYENGSMANLNHLDVSEVENFDSLFGTFETNRFSGDISRWDVSKSVSMKEMFKGSFF